MSEELAKYESEKLKEEIARGNGIKTEVQDQITALIPLPVQSN
jgi:hypothetical protein